MPDKTLNEAQLELARIEYRDGFQWALEDRQFAFEGTYMPEPGVTRGQTWYQTMASDDELDEYTNDYATYEAKQPDVGMRMISWAKYGKAYGLSRTDVLKAVDLAPHYGELFTKAANAKMKAKFITAFEGAVTIKGDGAESSETFDTNSVDSNGQVIDKTNYPGRYDWDKVQSIIQVCGEANWFEDDEQIFVAISFRDYKDIKGIEEFKNAQQIPSTEMAAGIKMAFDWEGMRWMVMNGLPTADAGATQHNYIWRRDSMKGAKVVDMDARMFYTGASTIDNETYAWKLNHHFGFNRGRTAAVNSSGTSLNQTRGVLRIENDFS